MAGTSRGFVLISRHSVRGAGLMRALCNNTPLVWTTWCRYLSTPTKRDCAIERLSEEIFSKGNVHLKNVNLISALPEGLHSFPEVCFIGKPNVGKSTLVSCLLHNPRLAKGGRNPGTTRSLQFFNVGDAFLLVDTPGYGGWSGRHLPQKQRERADAFAILFRYLALRKGQNLKRVYWLIESSATTPVSMQARDEEILTFLQRENLPFSIILTKIDRHRRQYLEQCRKFKHSIKSKSLSSTAVEENPRQIPTPLEGLRRNAEEVYAFLGTESIPIIGVSANRQCPARCENLSLLQNDIVHYCAQELESESELTYKHLHDLSYFPPSPQNIQRIKEKYPIEAFVVPQNNRLSLKKMVEIHERAKMHYMAFQPSFNLFPSLQMDEKGCLDSSLEGRSACKHDGRGLMTETLPPSVCTGKNKNIFDLPASGLAGQTGFSFGIDSPSHAHSRPEDDGETQSLPLPHTARKEATHHVALSSQNECKATGSSNPNHLASSYNAQHSLSGDISTTSPPGSDPLPHTAMAINGVHIPRSMIPPSVEELARTKVDELMWFKDKSAAGAYEQIIANDCLPGFATAPLFVEHDLGAQLPEFKIDQIQRPHVGSAAKAQKERLLEKYLDKKRKDRSIYMQAEGYMCPWLASAGQPKRETVMGLNNDANAYLRKGRVLKGLKRTGFGGKSYSANTLRNRGRATKKTGFWAA